MRKTIYAEDCRTLSAKQVAAIAQPRNYAKNYYKLDYQVSRLAHVYYSDGFVLLASRRDITKPKPAYLRDDEWLPDPGVEVAWGEHKQQIRCWWRTTVFGKRLSFCCPDCQAVSLKLYLPPGQDKFLCRRCYGIRYKSHHRDRLGQIGGMGRKLTLLKKAFQKGHRWGKSRRVRYQQIVGELEAALLRMEALLTAPKKLLQ